MFNAGRYPPAIPRIMKRWFFFASVHANAYEGFVGAAFRPSHCVSTCSAVPNPLSPGVVRHGLQLSPFAGQVPLRSLCGTDVHTFGGKTWLRCFSGYIK